MNHTPPDCLQRCYNHDRKVVPKAPAKSFFRTAAAKFNVSLHLQSLAYIFHITYIIYINFSTSRTSLHQFHPHHMHHLHLLYLRYISFTSPTSSTPTSTSHLQLFTSSISTWSTSTSSTSSTSIAQELLPQELPYRSYDTQVVIQNSLHRSSCTGFQIQVICLYLKPTQLLLLKSSKLSPLAAGAARRQLTKRDPLRNMWWNANFVGVACPSARNEDESHQLVLTSSFETSDATLSHKWRSNGKNWCKKCDFQISNATYSQRMMIELIECQKLVLTCGFEMFGATTHKMMVQCQKLL